MISRQVYRYHAIFISHNGELPHPCAYCHEPVTALSTQFDRSQGRGSSADVGIIHHKDENPHNNEPSNLEIMHHECHSKHHTSGQPAAHGYTPEIRAKISRSLLGVERSLEMRAKISMTMRGHAPANRVATLLGRCECGMHSNRGAIALHAKRRGHAWTRV